MTTSDKYTESHFLKRVAKHELTVLRDDGLYRHLRFRAPETCIDGFDIVTWPGFLCYCGDMGDYVFQRADDMLSFFRRDKLRINPTYWSEKVVAQDRDGVKQFDPDIAQAKIREWIPEDASDGLKVAIEELIEEIPFDECGEETVRREVGGFSYCRAGESDWYFDQFCEADLTEFTFRFIFCCYALAWGVRQYDARKAATAP